MPPSQNLLENRAHLAMDISFSLFKRRHTLSYEQFNET